jgi:ABC-type dipeptide/oligopeptide/nickel transport system permease component
MAAIGIIGALTATFVLIHIAPSDPVAIMFGATGGGSQIGATLEQREAKRRELGLDQPWLQQYVSWLSRVAHGDLGTSFRSRRAVATEMADRIPATIALGCGAVATQVTLGLGLGALAARHPGGTADLVIAAIAMALVSVPSYWLGLILLWAFAVGLGWVDVAGSATLPRLVLPALTLGLAMTPPLMRVFRASLIEQFSRAHVTFARARGLREGSILIRYVARTALLPAVTLVGSGIGEALGGAVIVESIFSWPGLGKYLLDSVLARDYPVVQGYMLFVILAVIGSSLIVDVIHGLLDPRLRTE